MGKPRASIHQQELSRREPTPEDEYFSEQERARAAEQKQEREERAHVKSVRSAPVEKVSDGIFGRIFRVFSRRFDTKWRL